MLYIKEWTSKNGNTCKAIFAKIEGIDYFVCFVK